MTAGGDGGQSGIFNSGGSNVTVDATARANAAAALSNVGTLSGLATANKSSVVDAINEVALGHIVKVAANGTLTITGDPTGTPANKFTAFKTAIEALDNDEVLLLPKWRDVEIGDSQAISVSNKSNVTIKGNDFRFRMTGTVRPTHYIKFTNVDDSWIEGIELDAGLDVTTSGSTGYGIYLYDCTNTVVKNCRSENGSHWTEENALPYGFLMYGCDSVRLQDCVASNWGYSNYEWDNCHDMEMINCDSFLIGRRAGSESDTIVSITNSTTTATCTTSEPHGLTGTGNNKYVYIEGATQAAYNGRFAVTRISDTVFTYVMASDPGGSATGTPIRILSGGERFFNVSSYVNDTNRKSFVWRGGRCVGSGEFQSYWDVNPGQPSYPTTEQIDYFEISNVVFTHPDRISVTTPDWGKVYGCKELVYNGVICDWAGLDRAITFWAAPLKATLLVKNCRFASGGFTLTGYSSIDATITNSVFEDCSGCTGAVLLHSGYIVNWDIDSSTRFDSCDEFFHDHGSNSALHGISKFDCYVGVDSASTFIGFRYPGNLGSIRLGPNFKFEKLGAGAVYLSYSLGATAGGNRLAVSDLNGVGHFDSLKSRWYVGGTGTMGVSSSNVTSSDSHQITTLGNPFPNTVGKLGDRIVNDNYVSNGYPRSWTHNGTLWVSDDQPTRMYNTHTATPVAKYFPKAFEIILNYEVNTGDPMYQFVSAAPRALASAWAPGTAYAVGQFVLNDTTHIYICKTAGTSAGSGGPTGTSTGITDNTVVWDYLCESATAVLVNGPLYP